MLLFLFLRNSSEHAGSSTSEANTPAQRRKMDTHSQYLSSAYVAEFFPKIVCVVYEQAMSMQYTLYLSLSLSLERDTAENVQCCADVVEPAVRRFLCTQHTQHDKMRTLRLSGVFNSLAEMYGVHRHTHRDG